MSKKDLTPQDMVKGNKYQFLVGPPTLIYRGRNWCGDGYWHQFSKVDEPNKIWSEIRDNDLHLIVAVDEPAEVEGAEV